MTATKEERHRAILALVNRGAVHTQQEIAEGLARRGLRATQATSRVTSRSSDWSGPGPATASLRPWFASSFSPSS